MLWSGILVLVLLYLREGASSECRDENGEWKWLEVNVDGRVGKLCVSPSVIEMGEADLLAASEDFCFQSRINGTACSVQVAAELVVATGKLHAVTRLDLAMGTAESLLSWSENAAAVDFLQSMLRSFPLDARLAEYYGIALHRRGRVQEAIQQFRSLLDGPSLGEEQEEDESEGERLQQRANLALGLATACMGQGDWEEALAWVDRAMAWDKQGRGQPPSSSSLVHLVRAKILKEPGGRTGEALHEARMALWKGREEAGVLIRDLMEEHGPSRAARYRDASALEWGRGGVEWSEEGVGGGHVGDEELRSRRPCVLLLGYLEEDEAPPVLSSSLPMVVSAESLNETVVIVHGLEGARQYLVKSEGADRGPQLVLLAPASTTILLGPTSMICRRFRMAMRERVLSPAATSAPGDGDRRRSQQPWSQTMYGEVGGGAVLGEAEDVRRVMEAIRGGEGAREGLARILWEQFVGRGDDGGDAEGVLLSEPSVSLDTSQEMFAVMTGHEAYTSHYRAHPCGGRLENVHTGSTPLVLLAHPRELQRMARDHLAVGLLPASQLLPPAASPASQGLRFYLAGALVEEEEEEGSSVIAGADGCMTLWTREVLSCLRRHPWRTLDRREAHVVLLDGVETAYEMNWPFYGAFGRGDNWGRPGDDSHDRRCWRGRNDERLLLARAPWRRLDQPVLVFDMHAGPQVYGTEDIMVAGSDLNKATFRDNWDLGFPPPAHRTCTAATINSSEQQQEADFLITFQGRATHDLRLKMASLHDEEEGVVVRVICMHPNQSESCIDQGDNMRRVNKDREGDTGYSYEDLLRRTTFSLVLRGDHAYSYRLLEVLSCGAIPIIVSDSWVLPFEELLDWEALAIRVPEGRWQAVVHKAQAVAARPGAVDRMRRAGREAYDRCFVDMEHQVDCMLQVLHRRRGGGDDEG